MRGFPGGAGISGGLSLSRRGRGFPAGAGGPGGIRPGTGARKKPGILPGAEYLRKPRKGAYINAKGSVLNKYSAGKVKGPGKGLKNRNRERGFPGGPGRAGKKTVLEISNLFPG